MKKRLIFVFVLSLSIFILNDVNAVRININSPYDNVKIQSVMQQDSIEKDDSLHSEIVVAAYLENTSIVNSESKATLFLRLVEGGVTILPINQIESKIYVNCLGIDQDGYLSLTLNCSDSNLIHSEPSQTSDDFSVIFNLTDIPSQEPFSATSNIFYLKLAYSVDDFVTEEMDHRKSVWLKTECWQCGEIDRFVVLPLENVIEDLENIVHIRKLRGRDVLEMKGNAESKVWFRDIEKELRSQFYRDMEILFLTIGATLIFQIGLASGYVKREMECLGIVLGFLLVITTILMLLGVVKGISIWVLGIICFIFFLFGIKVWKEDHPPGYLKEGIKNIFHDYKYLEALTMKVTEQRFVNGATLLGVALTLFALRDIGKSVNWQYIVMVVASIFFLGASLGSFFSRK